jgi:hypothetical protein
MFETAALCDFALRRKVDADQVFELAEQSGQHDRLRRLRQFVNKTTSERRHFGL